MIHGLPDGLRHLVSRPTPDEPSLEVLVRTAAVVAALFGMVGGVWGLVRGLEYVPTVPFAIIEGAILLSIPGVFIAIAVGVVAAGWHRLRWHP